MKDLHHNIKTVQTLDPAVTTTTRVGAPVDRRGFESVEHIVLIGASGDTLSETLYMAAKLEASEDGTTWEPVTDGGAVIGGPVSGSGIFATIASDQAAQMEYRIGYLGNARYSRISVLLTGTHEEGTPVSALAVLGAALVKPAT
jgi:hypothetical protein